MTTTEFSNEFDILYNNISSNQAPGLDEYEKSVFLTKAQDELVKAYFNPLTVKTNQGFDASSKRQYDFSTLIKTASIDLNSIQVPKLDGSTINLPINDTNNLIKKIDFRSELCGLPSDVFLIVNEIVEFSTTQATTTPPPVTTTPPVVTSPVATSFTSFSVIPISYTDYTRIMLKPYHYPVKRSAWRLINGTYNSADIAKLPDTQVNKKVKSKIIELIYRKPSIDTSVYTLKSIYTCRYVQQIPPIITVNLSGTDLSIKGINSQTECILPEECHSEIVQRAVELAMAAYKGDLTSTIQIGNISGTDLGNVPRQQNN